MNQSKSLRLADVLDCPKKSEGFLSSTVATFATSQKINVNEDTNPNSYHNIIEDNLRPIQCPLDQEQSTVLSLGIDRSIRVL